MEHFILVFKTSLLVATLFVITISHLSLVVYLSGYLLEIAELSNCYYIFAILITGLALFLVLFGISMLFWIGGVVLQLI